MGTLGLSRPSIYAVGFPQIAVTTNALMNALGNCARTKYAQMPINHAEIIDYGVGVAAIGALQ